MNDKRLPLSFYQSYDTLTLAQKLLGCELVHDSPDGITSGIIVETEAYLRDDPASHTYNRRTPRTEPMYGPAGTIYVYHIYGMYQCVNVVSNVEGIGEAVLIRALQPTAGVALMELRRESHRRSIDQNGRKFNLRDLCRGPGKLVQAMGIQKDLHNNQSLSTGPLYITAAIVPDIQIVQSRRIGINVGVDLPYRFCINNNIFTSK